MKDFIKALKSLEFWMMMLPVFTWTFFLLILFYNQ